MIGNIQSMTSPKFPFLLFFFSLASLAYSQSHVTFQKATFVREAEARQKAINDLSARLSAFQLKLSSANLGESVPRDEKNEPLVPLVRQYHGVGSNGFPVQADGAKGFAVGPDLNLGNDRESPPDPILNPKSSSEVMKMGGEQDYQRKGFYILPFIALQGSSDLETNFFGDGITVEHKLGFSSGWRVGHQWSNFFADADFSYFRNDFKALSGPELNKIMALGKPIRFSGEGQGYGVMINLGASFDLGSSSSVFFGAGGGPFSQELELKWNGQIVDDEQTVFAYQLFSGVNLYPSEHVLVSLRYRWLKMGKMEQFADRDLHMLEIALGYIF
jgi:opacity protein-like surface antigen